MTTIFEGKIVTFASERWDMDGAKVAITLPAEFGEMMYVPEDKSIMVTLPVADLRDYVLDGMKRQLDEAIKKMNPEQLFTYLLRSGWAVRGSWPRAEDNATSS